MAKAQAMVEFLTTYGWAVLALIIVLAVLISSGILSPNYLVSEQCSFGTTFRCASVLVNAEAGASTELWFTVINGFPYAVRIDDVQMVTPDGQAVSFTSAVQLESGANHTFKGALSGPKMPDNAVRKLTGNVTYVSCAQEIGGCSDSSHMISGRITAKVLR